MAHGRNHLSVFGRKFNRRNIMTQADIKCADGVLRPKSFCEAKNNKIYNQINIGLKGSNLRWPQTLVKHIMA